MIKRYIYIFCATVASFRAFAQTAENEYWRVYNDFMDLKSDPAMVAEVNQLTLQRDVGRFVFQSGKFYLCTPVAGKTVAAIFSGKGFFEFSPPTKVEKEQLERFYKTTVLNQPFKTVFLFFTDSTLSQLQNILQFGPGKRNRSVDDEIAYAVKYLYRKKGKQFDRDIMKSMLNNPNSGIFYAHFSHRKTDPYFFEINPLQEEEVRFMRRFKGPSFIYIAEVINQFHLQQDYQTGIHLQREDKSTLKIDRYDIEVKLDGNRLKFSATADVSFHLTQPNPNWLDFVMYSELEVDSAFWDNGEPVTYVKEKDNQFLWVKNHTEKDTTTHRRIRLHYHGNLIERVKDWFAIKSSRGWYPSHRIRSEADFQVSFTYPDKFEFAASGEFVRADTVDKHVTSIWRSPVPMNDMSFNIGFFKNHHIAEPYLPEITVQISETGHHEIAQYLAAQGVGSGRNMELEVGKDVAGSIRLFQDWFGKLPLNHFFATDIPAIHGEAFLGLIHLSWQTFQMTQKGGEDEIFRAHEVAHQWWGIGVDFTTYHDQWISEAFAEYCGWLYYLHLLKNEKDDDKEFYDLLEKRRDELIGNRKYLLGSGQKAGPIWLGYRTLSSDTQGDYRLVIYQKGALVLHMLRCMLLNTESGSDNTFNELLGNFYRKYQGKKVSTEEFLAFLEEFTGDQWDWFFDQWVYGTDIPEYVYQYQIEAVTEGFVVNFRVTQNNVPDEFKMPLLIGVNFNNDSTKIVRKWIDGKHSEFQIGPFSEEPSKITFNYKASVLSETKQEKWQE
jgi:hypothetical protein